MMDEHIHAYICLYSLQFLPLYKLSQKVRWLSETEVQYTVLEYGLYNVYACRYVRCLILGAHVDIIIFQSNSSLVSHLLNQSEEGGGEKERRGGEGEEGGREGEGERYEEGEKERRERKGRGGERGK